MNAEIANEEVKEIETKNLQEAVFGEDEIPTEESTEFAITDDKVADWAVRKILEEEKERDRLIELVDAQIEELQGKKEQLKKQSDNRTAYLKGCLNVYFHSVQHRATKTTEKYRLVSGELIYKKPYQKMVQSNEEETRKWLKENGMTRFVQTTEKTKWGDLKKILAIDGNDVIDTQTGEVVPGVKVESVAGEFKVEGK